MLPFKQAIRCPIVIYSDIEFRHLTGSINIPGSANSVRITTFYDKQNDCIELFPAFLKVGIGNMTVDNWAIGGLIAGIDLETGKVREWAYYKPGYGEKTRKHPDTATVFKDFEIPFFFETVELLKRFHSMLKNVHSIGWDVTITPTGPCIIEGNDNWEISALQVTNYGMKREFQKYM